MEEDSDLDEDIDRLAAAGAGGRKRRSGAVLVRRPPPFLFRDRAVQESARSFTLPRDAPIALAALS
jgi:hypothetical protein